MYQRGIYQNYDTNRNGYSQHVDINKSGNGINDLNKSGFGNLEDLNRSGYGNHPEVNNSNCFSDHNKSFMSTTESVRPPLNTNQFNINQNSPRRPNTNFLTGGLMRSNDYENHSRQVQPQENRKLKRSETVNYGRSNDPPIKSLREVRPFMNYTLASRDKSILQKPDHEQTHPYALRNTNLYSNETEDLDNWITVYGYEKKLTQLILSTFGSYGEIVAKKISNGSNYMHLKYSDKLIALAVRNKNGTILHNCMIGVKATTDLKLIDEDYNFPTIGYAIDSEVTGEPLKETSDTERDSENYKKNFVNLVQNDSAHYSPDLRLTIQQATYTPPSNDMCLRLMYSFILLIITLFVGYLVKIF